MASSTQSFVLAFSRTEEGELRIETAIKALSKQHARSAAFQMAALNEGALAFSKSGGPVTGEGKSAEILAQFGDIPPDRALHHHIGGFLDSGSLHVTSGGGHPLANKTPAAPSLPRRLARIMPFVLGLERRGLVGPKHWLIVTLFVTVGLAASASAMFIIAAKAAQSEARLMEMARPACAHTGITNKELSRIVRSEYKVGASKKDTLRAIVTLCQANL
jgi:hypothetical protein